MSQASGYRPLRFSSYFGKTMKRILNLRLKCHFESKLILAHEQAGFVSYSLVPNNIRCLEKRKILALRVDFKLAVGKAGNNVLL